MMPSSGDSLTSGTFHKEPRNHKYILLNCTTGFLIALTVDIFLYALHILKGLIDCQYYYKSKKQVMNTIKSWHANLQCCMNKAATIQTYSFF